MRKTIYYNNVKKALLMLSLMLLMPLSVMAAGKFVLVVDAGHGGKDAGCVGKISKEKHLALKYALAFGKMVERNCPDVKVVYTRTTDRFLELWQRAEIANKNKADLFISIHCNTAANASANGAETFVMGMDKANANMAVAQKENGAILKETNYENNYEGFDPYSPESYIIFSLLQNAHLSQSTHFASAVQKNFTNDLHRNDRGVKQAPFLVLWRTTMPSVLIELGFLSHKEEEAYLLSEKGKNELSGSIFKAVSQMIVESGGAPAVTEKETAVASEKKPAGEQKRPVVEQKSDSAVAQKENPVSVKSDSAAAAGGLVYKVQFAASSVQKPADDYAFRGLPKVHCRQSGSVYVYTAGEEPTYEAVQAVLELVRAKGYKDAFVIAFYKGERIRLDQAKKLEKSSGILK